MAAEGSLFKRCGCADADGKRLGARCPDLKRANGQWSSRHGKWGYQIAMPPRGEERRPPLQRSGFLLREDAADQLDQVKALLTLANGDNAVATEIADLLKALRPGDPLPERDDVARRVKAGVVVGSAVLTGDYLESWLHNRKIDANTKKIYGGHIRNHIIPNIGDVPLDKLRVTHLEEMFAAIAERNAQILAARQDPDPMVRASVRGKRPTSTNTMIKIRATLRKALNDAIRKHRLIEFNPAAHVELDPAVQPTPRIWTAAAVKQWQATGVKPSPVMVWTPEQAGEFLDYAEQHDILFYPMYALILRRGLRRGEVVGLREHQVDLDIAQMTISHQITTQGYTPVYKKVKTRAGDRCLSLDPDSIADLRAYNARKARWKLLSGETWIDSGYYFVKPSGEHWHPELVSERFDKLVAACGLPPIRLHDARHCAATFMHAAGADLKTISATLGHSTIQITADIYTSLLQEVDQAIADAAAALLSRNRKPRPRAPRALRRPAWHTNPGTGAERAA
ncbi:tyrosine-type recombinase/integrase [Longispora albida]|uniref:tyrosine-type recombinase/integrase n=1 Tax=Longispora albida TaxID=203523 RepID=UPI00036F6817|nr:site-specific integrase [Longispora albida]